MADQDYIIGAPGPAPPSVRHSCARCDMPVFLSADGEARRARATPPMLPLCVLCGLTKAAEEGEAVVALPYVPPEAQ